MSQGKNDQSDQTSKADFNGANGSISYPQGSPEHNKQIENDARKTPRRGLNLPSNKSTLS